MERMLYYIKKHSEKLYFKQKNDGTGNGQGLPAHPRYWSFIIILGRAPPFFKADVYSDQVNYNKATVEHQMDGPGHVVQDTAAGTRDMRPIMQLYQGNITGKKDEQV